LIAAARTGDRAAFGALYERYVRMIHGILLSRVAPADADDLVQEVFLTAMKQIAKLREPENSAHGSQRWRETARMIFYAARRGPQNYRRKLPCANRHQRKQRRRTRCA